MADGGAHALSWNRVVHEHQATISCQPEGQQQGGKAGLMCLWGGRNRLRVLGAQWWLRRESDLQAEKDLEQAVLGLEEPRKCLMINHAAMPGLATTAPGAKAIGCQPGFLPKTSSGGG